MKALLTTLVLALLSPVAFAAPDYYGMCKTELGKVASQLQSYYEAQGPECQALLDTGSRDNRAIGRACPGSRSLSSLQSRALAVCGQCRRLNNAKINNACTDTGLSGFVSAVEAL